MLKSQESRKRELYSYTGYPLIKLALGIILIVNSRYFSFRYPLPVEVINQHTTARTHLFYFPNMLTDLRQLMQSYNETSLKQKPNTNARNLRDKKPNLY